MAKDRRSYLRERVKRYYATAIGNTRKRLGMTAWVAKQKGYQPCKADAETVLKAKPARCPGCLRTAPLTIDHDHTTGRFRGWLCHRCNRVLGSVCDDAATLRRLVSYLK